MQYIQIRNQPHKTPEKSWAYVSNSDARSRLNRALEVGVQGAQVTRLSQDLDTRVVSIDGVHSRAHNFVQVASHGDFDGLALLGRVRCHIDRSDSNMVGR